jgi:O-acetyl-ADP-ribose deacetylase (regulator of RNase III)
MITCVTGDLFEIEGLDALAHGVNCEGRMGKGIAKEFRRRWPDMYIRYRELCLKKKLKPGNLYTWRDFRTGEVIFNLATQQAVGATATIEAVRTSLLLMIEEASQHHFKRIGLPRIGAGIGGLKWAAVNHILEQLDTKGIELVVVSLPE